MPFRRRVRLFFFKITWNEWSFNESKKEKIKKRICHLSDKKKNDLNDKLLRKVFSLGNKEVMLHSYFLKTIDYGFLISPKFETLIGVWTPLDL